jgi:hypothetical protein
MAEDGRWKMWRRIRALKCIKYERQIFLLCPKAENQIFAKEEIMIIILISFLNKRKARPFTRGRPGSLVGYNVYNANFFLLVGVGATAIA